MKRFEALSAELHTEYPRWLEDKYYGVIFIHPDDLGLVRELVESWFDDDFDWSWDDTWKEYRIGTSDTLQLTTLTAPKKHYDFAGVC